MDARSRMLFGSKVGSSGGVGMVELPEATCDEAMRLLAIYSEARTAFSDALDRQVKKRPVLFCPLPAGFTRNMYKNTTAR
jgi:hypothetical protein